MAVVQTQQLLYKISKMSKFLLEERVVENQREIICAPLKSLFPNLSEVELHYELLRNGLFDPNEAIDLKKTVRKLEEQNIWQMVNDEYERLRLLWRGPDIPIFIFPLTKYRPIIEGFEVKKNGVAYNGVLFLFLSTDLVKKEVKALFAHEYHHICRLAYLNCVPSELSLKDSLVIEGMAECAVEELYGHEWLSPWTKRFSFEEALKFWEKQFAPFLDLKGVKKHHSFLYGDGTEELPLWIGYCLGYRIVQSFLKNCGPVPPHLLYKTPTEEMITGSDFRL